MKPLNIDTNLYSYHLKVLQKQKFIKKVSEGYALASAGLVYAWNSIIEAGSSIARVNVQVMLVIQNSNGDVLLSKRDRQPFIDAWELPGGALSPDDSKIEIAAKRLMRTNFSLQNLNVRHAGDCYIRIRDEGDLVISTLVHVFRFETDEIASTKVLSWVRPHKLGGFDLAPAVEQIVTRTFFNDPHFFEEYTQILG